jgi:sirohydrochlorin ferrochelatase
MTTPRDLVPTRLGRGSRGAWPAPPAGGGPALVLVAHGTRHPGGGMLIRGMAEQLGARLAGVPVTAGFADVHGPTVAETLSDVEGPVIIVPAFLAAGYHVRVDVPRQAAESGHADVSLAAPLGPDPRVITAMVDRLRIAGWRAGDTVVMAAAGSTDARANRDVARAAEHLARRTGQVPRGDRGSVWRGAGSVPVGYLTAAPRLADVVAQARRDTPPGRRVCVASYLLAPGRFHEQVRATVGTGGADLVGGPIGAHPGVVAALADRYRAALALNSSTTAR